mgnify:CR=1 FL=1
MKKPDYVYVTYFQTTPEKAWQAFTDIDVMRQWWADPKGGCARVNVSDWQPGSDWKHQRADGSGIVDILGKVVEFTPPRRMVLTWGRPSEEHDLAKHSRLTLEVEPYTDDLVRAGGGWKIVSVKLTVLWTRGDKSFMDDAHERGAMRLGRDRR